MKQLRIFIILFIAKSQSLKVYDEDLHIHLNISNGAEKKFGSSVQNRLGRTTVSCGNHKASNCGECGNKYWCNGDCRWVHGQCEVNTGTDCVCGETQRKSQQNFEIDGGSITEIDEYPWMAFVKSTYSTWVNLCGGSLISDQWVVTAGHCVIHKHLGKPDKILVELGQHDRSSAAMRPRVEKYIVHEQYDKH